MKRDEQRYSDQELAVFAALRRRVEAADSEPVDSALYAGVLESVRGQARLRLVSEHELAAPVSPPARRRGWAALGGAMAVAAALILYFARAPRSAEEAPPSVMAVAGSVPRVRSELVLASGDVKVGEFDAEIGSAPLETGQHVSTRRGRACLGIDPRIDVCLDHDTEIVLDSLAENATRVRVLRGTAIAALPSRKSGHTFSLVSGEVTARARGTVFAISRGMTGGAHVVVIDGTVEVVAAGRTPAMLAPHSRLKLDGTSWQAETSFLGRSEEAQFLTLLAPRALWQDKALGVIDLPAKGGWLEASIGELHGLALPFRGFVTAGPLQILLGDGAGRTTSVEVDVVAGQTRTIEVPEPGPMPAKAQGPNAPETAATLLETARRELGRGETKLALALYRRLLANYPKSPEAYTVLVTVGQLELDQPAPSKALAAFNSYLKRGGALAPEALAGKIRALRALGKASEERTAIEQYLARYPSGFEAPALRRRLEDSR